MTKISERKRNRICKKTEATGQALLVKVLPPTGTQSLE